MASTRSLLREYFGPLANQPCWNASAAYGSWLSLNFGPPRLDVREGNPASSVQRLRRRSVLVKGEFLLWIDMGAWDLYEEGIRLFHSEQARACLRRAAGRLDAQKLVSVAVRTSPVRTIFTFDLGSQLHVRSSETAEPDEPLWHLYSHDNCLSLLAAGTLQHGAANASQPKQTSARSSAHAL